MVRKVVRYRCSNGMEFVDFELARKHALRAYTDKVTEFVAELERAATPAGGGDITDALRRAVELNIGRMRLITSLYDDYTSKHHE